MEQEHGGTWRLPTQGAPKLAVLELVCQRLQHPLGCPQVPFGNGAERPSDRRFYRPLIVGIHAPPSWGERQHRSAAVRRITSSVEHAELLKPAQDPGQRAGINVHDLRELAGRHARVVPYDAKHEPLRARDPQGRVHALRRGLEAVRDCP